MNSIHTFDPASKNLWQAFIKEEKLNDQQAARFEQYLWLLKDWNERINLTRIIEIPAIIAYHFQDSIKIRDFIAIANLKGLCDVGSGGGFPGIPLKIMFPEIPMVLIEVVGKKATFLNTVIKELKLEQCMVSTLDWLTFLRTSSERIDLFCARASLKPEELIKVFKKGSRYQHAQLVYWASQQWQPSPEVMNYLQKTEQYTVGTQTRVFAFFNNKELYYGAMPKG